MLLASIVRLTSSKSCKRLKASGFMRIQFSRETRVHFWPTQLKEKLSDSERIAAGATKVVAGAFVLLISALNSRSKNALYEFSATVSTVRSGADSAGVEKI
eukprot:m.827800 g.827800  ORF g.827800 m.827800 type:complete len:101 (+) comp59432_c1_seq4:1203-1505(+)